MQVTFGAGIMYGVPLLDAQGNTITNPTPVKFGIMQEMSLEFSGDIKELYGENQSAYFAARGKVKVSGKVKAAQLSGTHLNNLFFGSAMTSGSLGAIYTDLTGAVIPGTPYNITPTVPNSGTWTQDLGVVDANAVPMTRVASAPATGQYSVAAGVYTFAAADTGKRMFINFSYTSTNTLAKKISVQNLPMGYAPTFQAFMETTYQGKRTLVKLYNAISPKLALLSTKQDDFSVPEFEFSCFSDASNNVADIWISE